MNASARERSLGFVLAVSSVPVAIEGLLSAKPVIGPYGLISGLPLEFLIGSAMTAAAISIEALSRKPSSFVLVSEIALFIAWVWLGPELIFQGLPFPAAGHDLSFYPESAAIIQTGHIDPAKYIYQSWPGEFIFFSVATKMVGSTNYIQIFRVIPYLENLAISLFIFVFAKSITKVHGIQVATLAVLMFEALNYTEVLTTATPFAFGYVLYYCAVYLLLAGINSGSLVRKSPIVILIIILSALAISHPEIELVTSFAVGSITLFTIFFMKKTWADLWRLMAISSFALVGWTIFSGASYFSAFGGASIFASLFQFPEAIVSGSVGRFAGSNSYIILDEFKLAVVLILSSGALIVIAKGFKDRDRKLIPLAFVAVAVGAAFIPIGNLQGNVYTIRVFAYLLPALAAATAAGVFKLEFKLGKRATKLVVFAIIILLSSSSFVLIYSNLAVDNVSSSSIESAWYFGQYAKIPTEGQYSIAEVQFVGSYGPSLSLLSPYTTSAISIDILKSNAFAFVVLGSDTKLALLFGGWNATELATTTNEIMTNHQYNLVYSTGSDSLLQKINGG